MAEPFAKPVKKKRRRAAYELHVDKRYRIPFRMVFTLLLIFLGGLGAAFSFARITEIRQQISGVREAVQAQKEATLVMREKSTQRYTLSEIKREATERLGMHEPDASQKIQIYVPKQNVTVFNEEALPEPPSVWETISSFFSELFTKGR